MSSKTSPFEIPADLGKMSEESLKQVRSAIRGYVEFLERAVPENVLGSSDLGNKVLTYAERNVATAFEFGQRLMLVRDVQSLMKLQMEFIQAQTQLMTEQVYELRDATTKAVMDRARSMFLFS